MIDRDPRPLAKLAHSAPGTEPGAPAGLRMRPALHACRIGSRFIFLDLSAGRYFLLDGEAAQDFASFETGDADADVIERLRRCAIIEVGAGSAPPPPARAAHSLLDGPARRASLRLIAEAVCEQGRARRRIRREPLSTLLSAGIAGSFDRDICSKVAAACVAAARYRSATDQCLPNSLAMRAMLARRGIACDLVIGVMLPFAAHCWLQAGDMVLSDPFGNVQNFHPLVAV